MKSGYKILKNCGKDRWRGKEYNSKKYDIKFSEKVASNLSMANRLSFKNGVDGIIKMTALSEKLGKEVVFAADVPKSYAKR